MGVRLERKGGAGVIRQGGAGCAVGNAMCVCGAEPLDLERSPSFSPSLLGRPC